MYRFATFKLYNNWYRGSHNSVLAFVFSISRFPGGLGFVEGCKLFRHLGASCPVIMTSFLPLLSVGVELIDRVPSSLGTVCGSGFVLGFFSAVHPGWMWWSLRGLGCWGVAGGGSWPLRDRGFGGRGWVQWCGTPCKSGSIFVNSISLLYQMSKKCLQFSNAKQSIILTYNFINYNCPKGDPIFTL